MKHPQKTDEQRKAEAADKAHVEKVSAEFPKDRDGATGKEVPTRRDPDTGVAVRLTEGESKVMEPNWSGFGDKELASIILSRTGEVVIPGRMAHANLVARAQQAFRDGAGPHENRQDHPSVRPLTGNPRLDTAPKSGHHTPGEIAESASGRPTDETHPERRAMGDEAAGKPLTPAAEKK